MVILTKIEEVEKYLNQLNQERDEDYKTLLLSLGLTIFGVLSLAIFINIYVSYHIVKPLLRLTKVAEIINKIEKTSDSAELIKKKMDIFPVKC